MAITDKVDFIYEFGTVVFELDSYKSQTWLMFFEGIKKREEEEEVVA